MITAASQALLLALLYLLAATANDIYLAGAMNTSVLLL